VGVDVDFDVDLDVNGDVDLVVPTVRLTVAGG
jgi:hypothetical protein